MPSTRKCSLGPDADRSTLPNVSLVSPPNKTRRKEGMAIFISQRRRQHREVKKRAPGHTAAIRTGTGNQAPQSTATCPLQPSHGGGGTGNIKPLVPSEFKETCPWSPATEAAPSAPPPRQSSHLLSGQSGHPEGCSHPVVGSGTLRREWGYTGLNSVPPFHPHGTPEWDFG